MRLAAQHLSILALTLILGPAPLAAQGAAPVPPSYDELQAMIARMRQQVETLGVKSAERDEALRFLSTQIDQAAGQISGADSTASSLRGRADSLDDTVLGLTADRDRLAREAAERGQALGSVEQRLASLESALGSERSQRTAVATELDAARARLAALEQDATAEHAARQADQAALGEARGRIAGLDGELATLRQRLADARGESARSTATNADLDRQLKAALAAQVEELSQYRSEFFGRLRQVVGDRSDIRSVGDRFVFQSEVLFGSGSATLDPKGYDELSRLAQALFEVSAGIPSDLDWVLRVDGHTDRQAVRGGTWRSNWELSTARALSVVEYLADQGVPAEHLAAAGFGEFRPIDPGDDEIAYRRNRRIEFKLTEG